jgi:methylisocitrate lyase
VIFPVSLLRIAMGAVSRALEVLKRDGSVAGVLDQMQTRKELYDLVGYDPSQPWEFGAPGGKQK